MDGTLRQHEKTVIRELAFGWGIDKTEVRVTSRSAKSIRLDVVTPSEIIEVKYARNAWKALSQVIRYRKYIKGFTTCSPDLSDRTYRIHLFGSWPNLSRQQKLLFLARCKEENVRVTWRRSIISGREHLIEKLTGECEGLFEVEFRAAAIEGFRHVSNLETWAVRNTEKEAINAHLSQIQE